MASPEYFDILYVINPHMEGNIGTVNKEMAIQQWTLLKECYEQLGFPVHVIQAQPNLPDLVFTANQSFPFIDDKGAPVVIISRMASKHRAPEVEFFAEWFEEIA